jgi:hypothetical protein
MAKLSTLDLLNSSLKAVNRSSRGYLELSLHGHWRGVPVDFAGLFQIGLRASRQ